MFLYEILFDELLYDNFIFICNYVKNDVYVMVNVFEVFKNILFRVFDNEKVIKSLFIYLGVIIEDIDMYISNDYDCE